MGYEDNEACQGGCQGGYQDSGCGNILNSSYCRVACRFYMVAQTFYGGIEGFGNPHEAYYDDDGCPLYGRETEAYTCHNNEQGSRQMYVRVVLAPQELDAASGIDETVQPFAPLERMGFVSVCHDCNGY